MPDAPDDPISAFFATLAAGHHETFEDQSASIRFDVRDGASTDSWHVTISSGDVTVTHSDSAADAVIRVERQHLEAMVTGRLNAQAAILRGLYFCEGSMAACVTFQRCLPGPPGSTGRAAPISSQAVMAQHAKSPGSAA
jgi:hypothetical protein